MTLEIALTLAVLVGTVALFILDRFSPAVVALLADATRPEVRARAMAVLGTSVGVAVAQL